MRERSLHMEVRVSAPGSWVLHQISLDDPAGTSPSSIGAAGRQFDHATVSVATLPLRREEPVRDTRFDLLVLPLAAETDRGMVEEATRWITGLAAPDDGPITVRAEGAELSWCPQGALLRTREADAPALVEVIVAFSRHVYGVRQLELAIGGGWSWLESDRRLAFDVTARDLGEANAIGERMTAAFGRRIQFVQLAPALGATPLQWNDTACALWDQLHDACAIDDRLEAIDSQLEVAEHIYEMASQRLGEFRAAHSEQRLEWLIIGLLAVEVVMLLLDLLGVRAGG